MTTPIESKQEPETAEKELPKTRGQKWHDRIGFWGIGYGAVFGLSIVCAHVARHNPWLASKFDNVSQALTRSINARLTSENPDHPGERVANNRIGEFLNSPLQPGGPTRLQASVATTATITALSMGGHFCAVLLKKWYDRDKDLAGKIDEKLGTGLDPETEKKVLAQSDEDRFGPKKTWKDWFKGRAVTMLALVYPTGLLVSMVPQLDKGLAKLTDFTVTNGLKLLGKTDAYAAATRNGPIAHTDTLNALPEDQRSAVKAARWFDLAAFDGWYTALTAAVLFATSALFAKRRSQKHHQATDRVEAQFDAPPAAQPAHKAEEEITPSRRHAPERARTPLEHAMAGAGTPSATPSFPG